MNIIKNTEINWKRNIILFLGGQALSLFGSALVMYAIGWYITLQTQSGSMMSISIIVGVLPTFFISPFGGVWADRFNRKYLINIADASIALVTLILALFFIFGFKPIWFLFICSGVRALGSGVQTPAVSAIIPQIVPEEYLTRINGINSTIQSITMLLAPMVSGALLSFTAIEYIFFIDVITAAIGIGIVFFFVRAPSPAKSAEKQRIRYFHDIKEGFVYIKTLAFLKRLFIISAVFMVMAVPVAFLTPLQVTRDFGTDVWRLTAIEIAFSSGMLLGGLLIGLWGGFKNKVYSMTLSCSLFGLGTILLGIMTNFWIYLTCMAMLGLIMPLFNVPCLGIVQTKIEGAFMGRVFSVYSMISSVVTPMGMLIFGPLADAVAIDILLIGTGLIIFLLSFCFIISKTLREAGEPVTV
ncbi:MAG: MFS transporter [Treponema sp.]|jgi:DHA3 family macrolide efflux protein-like MFS transporter|nr:MFS transporter [Treponema sp.]